ncbi:Gfo/Idh/MocA family oxidoreductase [Cereibacter sp. SYSU M97828]|nr:Gfo/Idh/MocA family oxidoreductase [Cereibacter flavus]
MRIGVVGCGSISGIYLANARMFRGIEMVACADQRPEAAEAVAARHGIRAMGVEDLLASDVDLVLNLTVPAAHHALSMQAIRAGKHVFTEKPLCATTAQARELLDAAAVAGLQVGSAPDTFMGAAGRKARALVDAGAVGTVVTGTAFMMGRGMEHWHPNPAFYYQAGAGPVLDMGPYYLTMLTSILGPVQAVTAVASVGTGQRTITAEGPLHGTSFAPETPTTALSLLEFHSGAILTFGASWDVFRHSIPPMELHGTEGSLRLPDPDNFGDIVALSPRGAAWEDHASEDSTFGRTNYPFDAPDRANYRCLGLAEMADALARGREPRASGARAFHVLEVLEAVLLSAERRTRVEIESRPERPAPLDNPEELLA